MVLVWLYLAMEKIEIKIEWVDIEFNYPNTGCIVLIVADDVLASRLTGRVEGIIEIKYERYSQHNDVLILINFISNNTIVSYIDFTVPDNDRIKEITNYIDQQKLTCLFISYLNSDKKWQRFSPVYPLTYLSY